MSLSKRKKVFYAVLSVGIAFIVIGAISAFYTNIPIDVPIDGTLEPGKIDILTPSMNVGNTASIRITGSIFNFTLSDPDKQVIKSEHSVSDFSYNFTAQKEGEYRIEIKNTGDAQLTMEGHAYTKGNPIAFGGQMMLIVTGVIVTGLSLRLRSR